MSSRVSVTEAAILADVSRTTLYNDMDAGKLSFHPKGKNKREIDISELERVYGSLKTPEQKEVSSSVKSEQYRLTNDAPLMELALLRETAKLKETHHLKEIKHLENQISSLQTALDKAQDGYNSVTRLLEDQRSREDRAGDWERSLKKLETQIVNDDEKRLLREEVEKLKADQERRKEKLKDRVANYRKKIKSLIKSLKEQGGYTGEYISQYEEIEKTYDEEDLDDLEILQDELRPLASQLTRKLKHLQELEEKTGQTLWQKFLSKKAGQGI